MRKLLTFVPITLILLLFPLHAGAQQGTAILEGTVVDGSGGALPGVTVTALNEETGVSRSVQTDATGRYRMPAIQSGTYKITLVLTGFRTEERPAVRLSVGQEAVLDFTLQVGAVQEALTVTGETPLVDTQRSHVASTIKEEQIQELPLLSRNFLTLAALVPGAGRNTSITGTQPLAIGGADSRYNYTTVIDGGDVDDDVWGAPVQSFMQDSIKEFQVITNRFDAEHGKALEAVLNVVSKSGSNTLSGTAFGFFRDSSLKSQNYFETEKPEFDQQRTGGTVGGPILLNRTHYFAAYEFVNEDRPATVSIPAASPLSVHNGTFPAGNERHLFTGRLDHQLTTDHSLMVRALYEKHNSLGGFGGTTAYSAGRTQERTSNSVLAQATSVLSSRIVNDFRFQYRDTDVNNVPNSTDPTESRPSGTIGSAVFLQQEARHRYQFYDTMYFTLANHAIKAGGEITFMETSYCACAQRTGSFVFGTDLPFDPNRPSTWPVRFSQSINLEPLPLPDTYFGMFLQDDWRVTDKLTLNLGIRWDVDTRVRDDETMQKAFELDRNQSLRGVLDEEPGLDLDNIDPRLGFAYAATPALVVRGGAGIYHSRARMFMQALALDQLTSTSFVAVVTDPERLRFYPNIEAILGGTPEEFAATGLRSMSNVIGNHFEIPYAVNATLGFTQQFGDTIALNVDGVYSHSLHTFQKRVLNLPDSFSPTNRAGTAANPYKYGFGQILEQVTDGRVKYTGLHVGLSKRLSARYSGQVSYALSKALQTGANAHFYTPSRAIGGEDRGPTLNDLRHKLSVAGTVVLPWDVQASTIIVANSGPPYRLVAGVDLDGDGTTIEDRPEGLALNQGGRRSEANLEIVNAFRQVRGLSTVTLDQLAKRSPYFAVDLRLTKIVKLGGPRSLELMAEVFNLFNRTNFSNPNGTLTSATFLDVSSSSDGREAQLGVRFRF
jgi:carboxypeptidase family protein/TonB-dependent receptor-like protein